MPSYLQFKSSSSLYNLFKLISRSKIVEPKLRYLFLFLFYRIVGLYRLDSDFDHRSGSVQYCSKTKDPHEEHDPENRPKGGRFLMYLALEESYMMRTNDSLPRGRYMLPS